jgi:predicted MFS family arabinose efflux permease
VIGAFKNKNYLFLHIGFFACGFHVAFISTHLPGEINFHGFSGTKAALCFSILGLCNIVGCVLGGFLGGRIKLKNILAAIYAIRMVLVGVYLVLPKTLPVFIAFAALIGLTYLATVPPTGGITALLVHPKNLSTIFGIIFVTHQIGSFFGAWLAGILMVRTGSFIPMWIIDAALSLTAAVFSFKIVERR